MSELTNRNVLVVGEENSQIQELEDSFNAHGMNVSRAGCNNFDNSVLEKNKIDIIILNHLHSEMPCKAMLSLLKDDILNRTVPVFALVSDTPEMIQDVLTMGATDYLVPGEENQSVIQKMKMVFSDTDNFSGSNAIDITPIEHSTTTIGIKVFLVEDDPLLRNLLSIKLTHSSFPFEFSTDGMDIVSKVKAFNPDIIILDLMLPGRSGFEVLKDIKADETLQTIPVVVFSNRDSQDDRNKAEEMGVSGFYVKAMTDLSELVITIEKLVKK
jgi:DNA-binding response OmpR family regulator